VVVIATAFHLLEKGVLQKAEAEVLQEGAEAVVMMKKTIITMD
jgi:hypothetical protein